MYLYFVSYATINPAGVGNLDLTCERPIDSPSRVEDIRRAVNERVPNAVITSIQQLSGPKSH